MISNIIKIKYYLFNYKLVDSNKLNHPQANNMSRKSKNYNKKYNKWLIPSNNINKLFKHTISPK